MNFTKFIANYNTKIESYVYSWFASCGGVGGTFEEDEPSPPYTRAHTPTFTLTSVVLTRWGGKRVSDK